ncbi:hypothetical protein IMAU10566_02005 [Lactiplantibacillus plantarum]|nr:hypothetical protein [Lactiplantibacillus plantarum]
MFSVITKYHKGRHSLFLYNSEIFYAFTQDILRSRKIGLMAKADLEHHRYSIAVLNKLVVSFQMEALRNKGLSKAASNFYDQIYPILVAAKPMGTNLGYIGMHSTYLD